MPCVLAVRRAARSPVRSCFCLSPTEALVSTFVQDFRFSCRQLLRNPGVALTAIFSLALGIAATVSVFSLICSVILHPWPYRGADRIDTVSLLDRSGKEQNYS